MVLSVAVLSALSQLINLDISLCCQFFFFFFSNKRGMPIIFYDLTSGVIFLFINTTFVLLKSFVKEIFSSLVYEFIGCYFLL